MKRQMHVDGNTKAKLASKADQGKKITKLKKKATVATEVPHHIASAFMKEDRLERSMETPDMHAMTSSSSASSVIKEANVNAGDSGGIGSFNLVNMSSCCVMEGWEEYRAWLRVGVVDEQMSWGSTWMPFWDVEYMGEACCGEMFSDVMWDDDIWNLRHLDNVHNP